MKKNIKSLKISTNSKQTKNELKTIKINTDNLPNINQKLEGITNYEDFNKLGILDHNIHQQIIDIEENLQKVSIGSLVNQFNINELVNFLSDDFESKTPAIFKKNITNKKSFGMTKAVAERLIYMPQILENAKLKKNEDGCFLVRANFEDPEKTIGAIELEYQLPTMDAKTADTLFNNYIKEMQGPALQVLLSYWNIANDEGFFNYLAPLTSIMKPTIKNPNRYPSVNEKKRFWELSNLLANTTLKLTVKIGRDYITIKHPLLTLELTASKEMRQEENKGYPDKVCACVLSSRSFKNAATLATEFSKKALKNGSDTTLLAMMLEVKVSQTRNKKEPFALDELQLIKMTGLIKTYLANPRMARQRLEKKIDKAVHVTSIKSWKKHNSKIWFER